MTQLTTAMAMTSLFYFTHHAYGMHGGTTTVSGRATTRRTPAPSAAFQFHPRCEKYRNKPPCASLSQLAYSSDEVGIHNWLQSKEQTSLSDELHIDSDDHLVANRGEYNTIDGGDRDRNILLDDWTNDTNERRSRRLQSLDNFNQATNAQQQHILQSREMTSRKEDGLEKRRRASRTNNPETRLSIENNNLELPYNDLSQLQAIKSNAPAILLPSGPGTGKSHVLSLRIAYLLQKHLKRKKLNTLASSLNDTEYAGVIAATADDDECTPDSMVILSFTNRDAERLKERALTYLFPSSDDNGDAFDSITKSWRDETSKQLWAGTMHAFSLAILNKYGLSSSPLRVLPAKQMRNRVSASLQYLLNSPDDGVVSTSRKKKIQSRHLQALNDVGHSRSILYQNIVRCIELWKEANMPLTPPEPSLVQSVVAGGEAHENAAHHNHQQQREVRVRKACVELTIRLGVPKSSALIALDVYPEYQARHAKAGSADPSDLAGMAYRLLLDQPTPLHLLRSKLKHIIVDEYQDMSVSQHALLRLVVRGVINERREAPTMMTDAMHKERKAEQRRRRRLPVLLEPSNNQNKRRFKASSTTKLQRSYSVPSIFCAGDASQSIYGWRGGAPELTVNGFRRDYPQGIIAPLGTCYRLPNDIVEAAAMLLPMGLGGGNKEAELWDDVELSDSYAVSPAAAAKVASGVNAKIGSHHCSLEENVRLGNRLLLSKGMQKLDSTVVIHGLWDAREEAKYIASTIRRRSKERRRALIDALSNLDDDMPFSQEDEELLDLTDVAIMVRSSNQLHLIKEALENAGIPFATGENKKKVDARTKEEEEAQNWLLKKRGKQVKTIPMKPATIMTMHRSKGEEFDDVYLVGWTEGEFPHHDAVSSNRVHEERRLAYVALTRARQRVVITHSFMKRVLNYGRDGKKKYVTGQVQPSRFLYELMPSKRIEDGAAGRSDEESKDDLPWLPSSDNKGTIWKRSVGIKEIVAGENLPPHFKKSYQSPTGYVDKRSDLRRYANVNMTPKASAEQTHIHISPNQDKSISRTPLEIIEEGLKEIVVIRKKASCKKYTPIFKQMLASFFQIHRGNALVFRDDKQTQNESVYALAEAASGDLINKPLSRCTATQLGHYLAYLIISSRSK